MAQYYLQIDLILTALLLWFWVSVYYDIKSGG